MPRGSRIAWIAAAAVLAFAGCSPSDDPPRSPPSTSSPTSLPGPSVDSHPSGAPELPNYLQQYTPKQREEYVAAVDAYRAFGIEQARIYSAGKATPKAKRFYKTHSGDWMTYWARLSQREADGIRVVGRGETLRTRPVAVRLGDGDGTIDLKVCGIAEGVEVLQDGQRISQPRARPRIVNVRLIKLDNRSAWRTFWERPGGSC